MSSVPAYQQDQIRIYIPFKMARIARHKTFFPKAKTLGYIIEKFGKDGYAF